MRLVIFGANGGTGRLLTAQALDAGHRVTAITRKPDGFPVSGDRLQVLKADVYDAQDVADVLVGADAVLSTLGVPFTRKPITIYSQGAANIMAAMEQHGIKRLVVVSAAATEPSRHADGGFLLNRVLQPLITATIGKTTYADMRVMEALLRAGNLDWTVMRPSGLFDTTEVSAYELAEDRSERIFTSRADLAASILAQAESREWIGKNVAVNTVEGVPTLFQMIRREAFSRD